MSSQILIREELLRIAEKWPQVRLRYQFDAFCRTHAIEVHPAYLHEADPGFRSIELQLMNKITENFPEEGVYFTLPGDIAGIEGEPDGTIHGFWANMDTVEPEFNWPSEAHVVMEPVAGYGRERLHPLLQSTVAKPGVSRFPDPPAEIRDRSRFKLLIPSGNESLNEEYLDGNEHALAA